MNLIACPDLMVFQELVYAEKEKSQALDAIFAVQKAMIDQCERLGNRFAILDCPILKEPTHLLKWRDRFDTKYAALYYPRIEMINPEDMRGLSSIFIPPSGHLAGSYVDCDTNEGIHRAPANKLISGIVGLERIVEKEEYEILYPKGINCMRYIPGKGVKSWGARTLSSDSSWRFINIRRTFSAIRDSLKRGAGWAVFEPNTPGLRKRLVRHVSAFLLELWRRGYMMGNTPEKGFYVKCDDELNPPEEIDKGIIQVEIGLAIARPAEFLIVKLTANKDDSIVFIDE
jgi:phage tail sheath protein FI